MAMNLEKILNSFLMKCFWILFLGLAFAVQAQELVAIRLEGLERTKPKVVERELLNRVGEPFSPEKAALEKKRLEGLDLFAEVEGAVRGDTLVYRFTEIFSWFPAPSGKQSDQDGWMLGLALIGLNVLGEDIRVEGQARASVSPWLRAKEFSVYASSPYAGNLPLDWNLDVTRVDSYDALRGFHEKSWGAWLDLRLPLGGAHSPWSVLLSGGAKQAKGFGLDPSLSGGLAFDTRDAPSDPRQGSYAEMRVTQNGALADLRKIVSFSRNIFLWNAYANYRPGSIQRYDSLYQGGANSLRGYEPDSLVAGKSELLLNAEYRLDLLPRRIFSVGEFHIFWGLQAVLGADAAFLWSEGSPFEQKNYRNSVYGGLHLLVPALERIRVEAGYAPKRKGWVIAVGLFEKTTTQRWRAR
jgi:outer membrane protein assembly factor BamA